MKFNSVAEIVEDIKQGKMVILIDDEDRENEGDLIIAADYITPQLVNFMVSEARGLVCLALTSQQIKRLGIPLMVNEDTNLSPNKTAFTVSIEAAHGVTTGISAADRALTIKVAANPNAMPGDVIVPGHIFPIRAQNGGVLKRAGHTEASVDLARIAGLNPAAVICEIMNPDGTMARLPELMEFAKKHELKIGTIESLIQYRIENETFVEEKAKATLPSLYGEDFDVRVFVNNLDGREHVALVKGVIDSEKPILVRVHAECLMGDVFGSLRTRSGEYLQAAMRKINEEGCGVIVYLKTEDMGDRLLSRVKAYSDLDCGVKNSQEIKDAFKSDSRDYGVGAQILRELGVRKINLLTNTQSRRVGLKGYGLEIVATTPVNVNLGSLDSDTENTHEHEGLL
ncbi:MAG: 3,4-dihydroxy-2-butanone-4-phosphate synthase [Bdellovibrionales bacterium]|nr:3,4-dihydroxy-2-butanone-4-phosphate synthase [Bdellovibrionales bacterium]